MARPPGSLKALISRLIDYAGLYPPAALPLEETIARYVSYLSSRDSWILNRLVLPAARLAEVRPGGGWRISLLAENEPGALPSAVEAIETKRAVKMALPTYCEAGLDSLPAGAFAKIRTGALQPEGIPDTETVAEFLLEAAARRIPFKATAGLHHAFRSNRPLTYAPDSPRAVMHGFVNVFTAAALAWRGAERAVLAATLEETDPAAFEFRDEELRWRGRRLGADEIAAARERFAHSFGSCSFEEPVAELRQLDLLP